MKQHKTVVIWLTQSIPRTYNKWYKKCTSTYSDFILRYIFMTDISLCSYLYSFLSPENFKIKSPLNYTGYDVTFIFM